jgi:3',5'-cyclic AMP phosphodiesterase CpdA
MKTRLVKAFFAYSIICVALSFGGQKKNYSSLPDSVINALPKKGCITFIAFGDWGWNGQYAQTLVADALGEVAHVVDAGFIVSCGDNFQVDGVRSVTDPLWQENFENVYKNISLQVDWYLVLGNHDYKGNPQAEIDYSKISRRWNMPARYYVVHKVGCNDAASLDLYMLDTSPFQKQYYKNDVHAVKGQDTAAQLRWLDSSLAVSTSRWKICVGHHSLYTGGMHAPELTEMPGRFEPIFAKYNVDAYFSGHDHDLEHITSKKSKVNFFVSGCGGEPRPVKKTEGTQFMSSEAGFMLVNVSQNEMTVSAINTKGTVLYSVTLTK